MSPLETTAIFHQLNHVPFRNNSNISTIKPCPL